MGKLYLDNMARFGSSCDFKESSILILITN